MTNKKKNNNRRASSNGSKRPGANQRAVSSNNKQKKQPSRNTQAKLVVHVSKCAQDYARCLMNPFDGPLACIPDYPALHSRRVRVFSRGVVGTSGTTGIGFITLSPLRGLYSDGPMGVFTTSAYAGTTIDVNSATAGVDQYFSNADYTSAQYGSAADQVQGRVVAAGLRIKYRGTELNRGGTIYALTEPTHDNLNGSTISALAGQADCKKFAVNGQWTNLYYKPFSAGENQFGTTSSTSTNDTAAFTNYMVFMIQAPTPTTACEFEFEAYEVAEYTGRNVRGTQPSHFDPTGFAAVHAVAASSNSRLPSQGNSDHKEKSFLQEIEKYLLEGISWVGNTIGGVVRTAQTIGGALAAFM